MSKTSLYTMTFLMPALIAIIPSVTRADNNAATFSASQCCVNPCAGCQADIEFTWTKTSGPPNCTYLVTPNVTLSGCTMSTTVTGLVLEDQNSAGEIDTLLAPFAMTQTQLDGLLACPSPSAPDPHYVPKVELSTGGALCAGANGGCNVKDPPLCLPASTTGTVLLTAMMLVIGGAIATRYAQNAGPKPRNPCP